MSAEWLAARETLEARPPSSAASRSLAAQAQLRQLLSSDEPIERLQAALGEQFPELASASAAAPEAGEEKREQWEKQLVEHCFFRVLDALMAEAIAARQPLMQRSQALVFRLLDAALLLCEGGTMIEPGVIFALLEHVHEGSILPDCDAVFGWMELQRGRLAVPGLWARGKLILLRTCNNLLRRLSRALHTVFCGRVLLLLAALFPLSERSALNMQGAYNAGNRTEWDGPEAAAAGLAAAGLEEGEVIDGAFYDAFWGLQHFFSAMPSALPAAGWARLARGAQLMLSAFEGDPLAAEAAGRAEPLGVAQAAGVGGAKYLTASQLLRLELRDPAFRRALLLQLLLLLRFARGPPPPPPPGLKAAGAAEEAARLAERAAACLRAVPPGGPAFADAVEAAMERDRNWVLWKAGGCKPFERPPQPEAEAEPAPAPAAEPPLPAGMRRRRPAPPPSAAYKVRLGNPELDRLWNEQADLAAASTRPERGPPALMAFVEPLREQLDPAWCAEMELEEAYKRKHDRTLVWQTLRLVTRSNLAAFGKAAEWEGGAADIENVVRELHGMPRPPKAAAGAPGAAPGAEAAAAGADEGLLSPAPARAGEEEAAPETAPMGEEEEGPSAPEAEAAEAGASLKRKASDEPEAEAEAMEAEAAAEAEAEVEAAAEAADADEPMVEEPES